MPSVNDMYISVSRDAAKSCKQFAKHVSKLLIAMFLGTLLRNFFLERERKKKRSEYLSMDNNLKGKISKIQKFTIQFFEH